MPDPTPLHALVRLAKEQDLAIDIGFYGRGDHYEGGVRLTGVTKFRDPMDVIRDGVRELERRRDA